MKFKALISSLLFIVAFNYSGYCQTFEFAKVIGNTSINQGSGKIEQLPNGGYFILSGIFQAKKNFLKI